MHILSLDPVAFYMGPTYGPGAKGVAESGILDHVLASSSEISGLTGKYNLRRSWAHAAEATQPPIW